mmetsp:Transcript_26874/g.75502  ORF Transcript_26874/g.75502 Transcript_26874/m.75502 type:complete len:205 (+) Transcript_26874:1600-2214(+)
MRFGGRLEHQYLSSSDEVFVDGKDGSHECEHGDHQSRIEQRRGGEEVVFHLGGWVHVDGDGTVRCVDVGDAREGLHVIEQRPERQDVIQLAVVGHRGSRLLFRICELDLIVAVHCCDLVRQDDLIDSVACLMDGNAHALVGPRQMIGLEVGVPWNVGNQEADRVTLLLSLGGQRPNKGGRGRRLGSDDCGVALQTLLDVGDEAG